MANKKLLTASGSVLSTAWARIHSVVLANTTAVASTIRLREGGVAGSILCEVNASGAAADDTGSQDFGPQGQEVYDAYVEVVAGAPRVTVNFYYR